MILGALLLAVGFVLGVAGAAVPSLIPVWNAPEHERLRMIAERRRPWQFSALAFAASIAAVATGLGPVSVSFDQAGGGGAAWVGFAAFMLATALALPVFAYRFTVTTRIAYTVADGGDIPVWYRSASGWVFLLLVGYVALASLGLVAYGFSVVSTEVLPNWSGWVLIGLGTAFIVSSAIVKDIYPVEPHLGTGLIALLLLIQT